MQSWLNDRTWNLVPREEPLITRLSLTRMGCLCLYARMGLKKITPVLWHFPITVHLYDDAGRVVLAGAHDRVHQERSPTVHRDRQSVSSAPKDR